MRESRVARCLASSARPRARTSSSATLPDPSGVALHDDAALDPHVAAFAVELEPVALGPANLLELLGVLDETEAGLGVGEDVSALVRQVRLIDGDRHPAAGVHREVGFDPFGPRSRQDRDLLTWREAERQQPRRRLHDATRGLLPAHLLPRPVALHPIARPLSERRRAVEEHLGEILMRHRHPSLVRALTRPRRTSPPRSRAT